MTAITTTETAKKTNRALQRTHSTYKSKADISEALHLIRPYINESTYKWLSHFLHTKIGVTQAKNATICEKAGIAERTYYKTVKPEIEGTFSQALIITTPAPMKYDKKRKKRVKASPFKSLLPLSIIKHLVRAKETEEQEEYTPNWENFLPESAVDSAVKSAVDSAVESNLEIPCESKSESHFEQQQNKSFREKHLEKPFSNNNRFKETDIPKRYQINSHLKNRLELHPFFTALEKDKQYQVANKFQLAFIRTGADFQDRDCMDYVLEAYRRFINDIEKGRKKITKDYYGALYVYLENAIHDYRIELEQEEEDQQPSTFIIDREQQAKDRYEYKQQQAKKPKGIFGLIGEVYDMDNVTGDQLADWAFGNIESLPLKPEKRERKDITAEVTEGKWNAFKNWQEKNADKLEELPY